MSQQGTWIGSFQVQGIINSLKTKGKNRTKKSQQGFESPFIIMYTFCIVCLPRKIANFSVPWRFFFFSFSHLTFLCGIRLPERSHKGGYSFSPAWGKKMGLDNDESCLFLRAAQCLRTLRHIRIICSSFLPAMAKTDTGCVCVCVHGCVHACMHAIYHSLSLKNLLKSNNIFQALLVHTSFNDFGPFSKKQECWVR